MLNVLLSSYNFHEPWAKEVMNRLLKPEMKVCVIPFSFDDKEIKNKDDFDVAYGKDGRYTPYILRPFYEYGIKEICMVDYFKDDALVAKNKVENADVLFLTGGLTHRYMEGLIEFGLVELIQSYQGLIIGTSAGAMIQLDEFHVTPDDDYPIYHMQRGMGLVSGFELEVHYAASPVQLWSIDKVVKERGLPLYCEANDGGLLIEDGKVIPFGEAFLFDLVREG